LPHNFVYTLVEKKEVALSIGGQQALGMVGLILVTIAAAFSTGSAINTTALVDRPFILKRMG